MDFSVIQPKVKMTPYTEIPKSILKNKRKRGPGVNSLLHSQKAAKVYVTPEQDFEPVPI